jgi:hypothetical protein
MVDKSRVEDHIKDTEELLVKLKLILETGVCTHPSSHQALNYGDVCDTCGKWL